MIKLGVDDRKPTLCILLFSDSPFTYSTNILYTNGFNYLLFFTFMQTIFRKNILFFFFHFSF